MKPFVAVIGDRKSGKSTIIRSLTGCPTGSFVGEVGEKVHGKKIYVVAHSLQEKKLAKGKSLSGILKKVIDDDNILGIVIAIQPNNPTKKISMEKIFQTAQKTGGFSFHAFVINPSYNDMMNDKINRVREGISVLKEKRVMELDGRRFALHNANNIQQAVKLV